MIPSIDDFGRPKTTDLNKLGNINSFSNMSGDKTQCPVFPLEIKLSKIGFSMECFAADLSQIYRNFLA